MKGFVGLFIILIVGMLGCKVENVNKLKDGELITKGKLITKATFNALSKSLLNAMAEGGVHRAVEYCNIEALAITDSLSAKYNVEIKRTSDRIRNPMNTATSNELKVIKEYKRQMRSGDTLYPQILRNDEVASFYAPILTNGLCLKCHGSKTEMESYGIIKELYPDDLATEYKSGQLRGVWSVRFLDE